MTLETSKEAIEQLPPEERKTLASWLSECDWKAWDEQIERGFSQGGGGMPLLAQLEREIAGRKTCWMEEEFGERHKSRVVSFQPRTFAGSGNGTMN